MVTGVDVHVGAWRRLGFFDPFLEDDFCLGGVVGLQLFEGFRDMDFMSYWLRAFDHLAVGRL